MADTDTITAEPKKYDFVEISRAYRFERNAHRLGTVYFIGYGDGPIKIGFTTDLSNRVQNLQTGCPYRLSVLASLDATPATEWEYHERFAACRLRGEWFEPHPDILAEIDLICSKGEL